MRRLLAERADGDEYEIDTLSVGRLPLYDWDVEQACGTDVVHAAEDLVRDADTLVVSTPSYNGELPGRPQERPGLALVSGRPGDGPLTGRTVAPASASPGARGAVAAVLTRCDAQVVDHDLVAVGRAGQLRAGDGGFTDPSACPDCGARSPWITPLTAAVREPCVPLPLSSRSFAP
ncbi:hypothetical protein M878_07320 [Streptomyces roseochromogenus subsp. oscitans DS 12.976]|uniref:NADPH-dependent FMN reductase-like domain-containing protein n=1 Tax=Streptomyces roseochromogenus subsp. oscitans DS 12.976 TaxID=1352936 RepID=V6KS60_STRRC|nr:hypothetical protein M878_07320 [Streptomyces roseochromogenus subsp. oscitans DS 12.976]